MRELDLFVENHLNLQVKISYREHHDFLVRHGLGLCGRVLDVGTGNGVFVARLAQDHPSIQFVGIDKRSVESCRKLEGANLRFELADMFKSTFDLAPFDGFLMRYFLLHVDNAKKILDALKAKAKPGAKLWVIDLDWSQFQCEPPSPMFDGLTGLVKDFCTKISKDSLGGQNVVPLLQEAGYRNVVVENIPFSVQTISLEDFVLYLKQEVQCYSMMAGRPQNDPETLEIVRFIEDEVRAGKHQVTYGMILVSASLI